MRLRSQHHEIVSNGLYTRSRFLSPPASLSLSLSLSLSISLSLSLYLFDDGALGAAVVEREVAEDAAPSIPNPTPSTLSHQPSTLTPKQ